MMTCSRPVFCLAVFMVLILSGGAEASPQGDIMLSSTIIPQGGVGLIRVTGKTGDTPRVFWMDREVLLVQNDQNTLWYGFFGVDLTRSPGRYSVVIKRPPSTFKKEIELKIVKKDYGVRRLTLPKKMVDLDQKTLKRVKKESKIMKALWGASPSVPLWRGSFLKPVPGEVKGAFGRRSVINNQPRSPHSGIDLRGKRGTPVKGINHGRVVLRGNHFFTGLTVVIDHGGGIQSMYFHLDKIMVQQDRIIKKGDVIGLVGSTGRSTGPHLHWGIRINNARIDPMELKSLSSQLKE